MTDFVQGQLRVRFRFGTLWPMLEIFRKLYLFTGSCRLLRRLFDYARGSTQNGKKNKTKNTSRIYDLGVVPTRGNKRLLHNKTTVRFIIFSSLLPFRIPAVNFLVRYKFNRQQIYMLQPQVG